MDDPDGDLRLQLVCPLDIFHSQSFVTAWFAEGRQQRPQAEEHGSYAEALASARASQGLQGTLDNLLAGLVSPADFPPMRCVHYNGQWVSLDNRRLWVLKTWASAQLAGGHPRERLCVQVQVVPVEEAHAELHRKLASGGLLSPCASAELRTGHGAAPGEACLPFEAVATFRQVILTWTAKDLVTNPGMLANRVS